eukprot:4747938-Prymnesium_polylepis.1
MRRKGTRPRGHALACVHDASLLPHGRAVASWMGFYINAAAAPARVALGFLCFLCVMNNISAVRAAVRWGADDALRTPSTQSFETHAHKHCLLACALKTFLARD